MPGRVELGIDPRDILGPRLGLLGPFDCLAKAIERTVRAGTGLGAVNNRQGKDVGGLLGPGLRFAILWCVRQFSTSRPGSSPTPYRTPPPLQGSRRCRTLADFQESGWFNEHLPWNEPFLLAVKPPGRLHMLINIVPVSRIVGKEPCVRRSDTRMALA
jgi:hypothetical protein